MAKYYINRNFVMLKLWLFHIDLIVIPLNVSLELYKHNIS